MSTRDMGRRFRQLANQGRGQVAYVGDPDGVTVNVPDTTNQVWIRLNQDDNRTYPAFKNTLMAAPLWGDIVWVEKRAPGDLKRADYWIVGAYTFTP